MTRAALVVCLVSAAVAIGCGEESAGPDAAPVRERTSSLPSGCRPAEVARPLDDLFDALNRGDEDAAAALVVNREMLVLLKRPAAGRPLRLTAVIVGFGNGLGQIAFQNAGRLAGTGAVDCEARKLAAVGFGVEHVRMAPFGGGRRACAQAG